MIPEFPSFVGLDLQYVPAIISMTKGLPEYSDYNPVSMLAWDIENSTEISNLNGNLVVIFRDYLNGSKFIAIHGTKYCERSIRTLLSYAEEQGVEPTIRLVAEEFARKIRAKRALRVSSDRDNFDYLVSLEDVIKMSGKKHRRFRQQINFFQNNHGTISRVENLDLTSKASRDEILEVFKTREAQNIFNDEQAEYIALQRCMDLSKHFDIVAKGVRINGKLEGFIIIEKARHQLVEHFKKANISYVGIYQYLLFLSYKSFYEEGFRTINIEQDLGIKGLRTAKKTLRPTYLRKFSVTKPKPLPFEPLQDPQQLSLRLVRS